MQHQVKITRARVEVRFTLGRENASPNGLYYDQASDTLLLADQAEGALLRVENPTSGARRESAFAVGAPKPSGVVRFDWGGIDTVIMSGTYGRELSVVQGEKLSRIDHRGIGTGIVDFAQDRLGGTHTGFHGLEWDGRRLWAASPPARAIMALELAAGASGAVIASCSWFPIAAGNRPHGLAWADESRRELWCNDTTLGTVYRYEVESGAVREILVLPEEAPQSHGLTMVGGRLWYCEDHSGTLCEIIPLTE